MNHLLVGEVLKHAGELEDEGNELFEGQGASVAHRTRQRRPFQMLEHKVGPIAFQHGGEPANEDRMRESFKKLRLAGKRAQGVVVVHQMRPNELRDDERVEVLIPRQEHLVVPSTADLGQHESTGDDRITLIESPPLARRGLRLLDLFWHPARLTLGRVR